MASYGGHVFLTSLKWKLDAEAIRATPRTQGVLGLWDEEELVYIGATERDVSLPETLPRYNRATSPLPHEIQTTPHFA